MALTEEGGGMSTTMLVGPATGMGTAMPYPYPVSSGNTGSGLGWGGDGWWILLLFILLAGGWNHNGNGGGYMGAPYVINNDDAVQSGFNHSAIMGGLDSIQNGLTNIQQDICNGFSQAEIADNSRQMANMQQMFNLSSQFANCCCENRLATSDLKYTIATEACADRAAVNDGIRDVITNQNNGVQRILDQLCADKIDAKNEKIADLERQLTMANLSASQTAQTARLLADNNAQTVALEQYLNPVPVPAYIVQNPNCCQQNYGCGGNF